MRPVYRGSGGAVRSCGLEAGGKQACGAVRLLLGRAVTPLVLGVGY